MYIDLEQNSKLQPYVLFDWRFIAERGLRCYRHCHVLQKESKSVATCEISFLIKARIENRILHHNETKPRILIISSSYSKFYS